MYNLSLFQEIELYFHWSIGLPMALFFHEGNLFRRKMLDWRNEQILRNTLLGGYSVKISSSEMTAHIPTPRVEMKMRRPEIILASGVSEKGRMLYRMYEERFGGKV